MSGQYSRQIRAGTFACLVLAVGVLLCCWGVQQCNQLEALETRGVPTVGALENAAEQTAKRIPIAYSFTVRYLDRLKTLDVSSELFHQYVRHEQFSKNAPIELLYLPEDPDKVMPQQMRGVRFYWTGGPVVKFLAAVPIIAFSGLIFWAISLSLRFPPKASMTTSQATDFTRVGAGGEAQIIDIRRKPTQP